MGAISRDRPRPGYNPAVLRWARERRLIALDYAAKRAGVSPERVQAWEAGSDIPTVRQARMLADLYERPFLEFFSGEIPELPQPESIPDFRMHRDAPDPSESLLLRDILSWAETQRLNALDLYDTLGERPPHLSDLPRHTVRQSADDAAYAVRELIGPPVDRQLELKSAQRAGFPKIIRTSLEAAGILVLKNNQISKIKARGICIIHDTLPVVIFGGEVTSSQAFTLVHELAHVTLGESAVSGPPGGAEEGTSKRRIEDWCNRFAGAFLIPQLALERIKSRPKKPVDRIDDAELQYLANKFSVSRHAMMIRLVHLRYVVADFYWKDRRLAFIDEEENVQSGGRTEYYGSRYRSSLGDLYTGLVLEAWASRLITNHNAGEYMGIKNLQHLDGIKTFFGG